MSFINEKDEISRNMLKVEDLVKKTITDANRIHSSCFDNKISEITRQVRVFANFHIEASP